MPVPAVQTAQGKNPQNRAQIHRLAYQMRIKGKSLAFIGRALAGYRTGRLEGKPWSTSTVHEWVKKALEAEAPKDKALRVELQRLEEARLDGLLSALEAKLHPKPCATCGQGDVDPGAVGQARKISESRRKLLGLDEPSQVAVHNATRETLDVYSEIVKQTVLDHLPVAQAQQLLHQIEVRVCEATGETPPADVEVEALEVAAEVVG